MSGMTPDLYGALAVFAFVSSITPGPNNTMLMASGANFGLKASIPHMLGVSTGFATLLLLVGLVLGGVFTAYPALHVALAWIGVAYLLYLAVKIALTDHLSARKDGARPMRFAQAAAFQAVNPKAWAMGLGAMTRLCASAGILRQRRDRRPDLHGGRRALHLRLDRRGRRDAARPRSARRVEDLQHAMALVLVASLIPTVLELVGGKLR